MNKTLAGLVGAVGVIVAGVAHAATIGNPGPLPVAASSLVNEADAGPRLMTVQYYHRYDHHYHRGYYGRPVYRPIYHPHRYYNYHHYRRPAIVIPLPR